MRELISSLRLDSEVDIETPPPSYDPYFLDEDAGILEPFRKAYRVEVGKDPYFAGHRGIV